jgi:hypothetical protein
MDFGQLCADVMVLSGRPDLINDTQLAVRTATLKFHMIDFWKRDLIEKSILLNASASQFQVDTLQLERFRKLKYIQPLSSDGLTPVDVKLKEVEPDNIFDQFSARKSDVYYLAGTNLNIKTANGYSGFIIGWYRYPLVMPSNYNSWIADFYPSIITEEAAGRLMYAIGNVDEANKFVDPIKGSIYMPGTGHLAILRANELEATAR